MFDDENDESTPLDVMNKILAKNPNYENLIHPYLGDEEFLNRPNHAHHRFVIDLGQVSEEEAWSYPELMSILEEKVKPRRAKVKRNRYRAYW